MSEPMRVRYARKVNCGDYSNFDVEISDDVRDGETPAMCLARLQAFVDDAVQRKLVSRSSYFADQDLLWLNRFRHGESVDPSDDFIG